MERGTVRCSRLSWGALVERVGLRPLGAGGVRLSAEGRTCRCGWKYWMLTGGSAAICDGPEGLMDWRSRQKKSCSSRGGARLMSNCTLLLGWMVIATGGGSTGTACRGTRRRMGGASMLCQVAKSCSYALDGLRSWLRDRCCVLGVNLREGILSWGLWSWKDRERWLSLICTSVISITMDSAISISWSSSSASISTSGISCSSLWSKFTRHSESEESAVFELRQWKTVQTRGKVSWQCKSFLTKQVRCDLWNIENDLLYSKHAKRASNQNLSTLHIQVTSKQMTLNQTQIRSQSQHAAKRNRKEERKFIKFWINNIDSTRSRVHRIPSRHMFRVDTRSYKWLEASQRQNGS